MISNFSRRFLTGTAFAALALIATPAAAADCADMAGMSLPDGEITSATLVSAGEFAPPSAAGAPPGVAASGFDDLPEFCRVQAVRRPSSDSEIVVEVWLPASGWNGKFVGIGNGIWAGTISFAEMGRALAAGYAVGATDTGHVGNGMTADFAVGHPEKLIDFGYRAVHEMVVTSKLAINDFYNKGPELSFWNSCSTGGRQGVMSAHRYPEDFDAISAMAPANPMTNLMTQTMWAGYQAVREEGSGMPIPKLALTHQAVMKECDALDGLTDQLLSRPDLCTFDPISIQCPAGTDGDTCLSAPQVTTMRNIYDGVRNDAGEVVLPGWPRGSEMQVMVMMMGQEPFPVATSFFRQLVFGDQPGWDFKNMSYGKDLSAAQAYAADILDAPSDGLGPFFARGGKLLLSHGWNDGLIPATNVLKFHHGLYNDIPAAQAQQQLRLYMVPGMEHCSGGEGVSSYDTLGTIDAWATTGVAPFSIIASRVPAAPNPFGPAAPELPPLSRPLCPYPMAAQYNGSGDVNEAENFSCVVPDVL